MDEEAIRAIIEAAREERAVELKGPVSWANAEIKGKLCKALIALANLRDGGLLIIGIEEIQRGVFEHRGLVPNDVATFNQDDVAAYVAEYATPYVEFVLHKLTLNKREYVVMVVLPFAEVPVVCRKDGPSGLRRGAIYTRSRRQNESVEVSSESEMREILEMAVDRQLRRFFERARVAGFNPVQDVVNQAAQFREQLGDL